MSETDKVLLLIFSLIGVFYSLYKCMQFILWIVDVGNALIRKYNKGGSK